MLGERLSTFIDASQIDVDGQTLLASWFRVEPHLKSCCISLQWQSPPAGFWKLNTDVSLREGLALGGGIVHGINREFAFAFYKEFGE